MSHELYLIVARGHDIGARLLVGDGERVVGRARDADLVLLDRRVSRRHLRIRAEGEEAHVATCDGASAFVLDGKLHTEAKLRVGDTVIVGETALLLALEPSIPEEEAPDVGAATDVGELLTGLAVDVRGLAGVFTLVEALDAAVDLAALKAGLVAWARVHAETTEVEFHFGEDVDRAQVPAGLVREIVMRIAPEGDTVVSVPAHTQEPGWISFRYGIPETRVTASLRRLLVVAGRIWASRLAQLSVVRTLEEDRESLRQQALGSSYTFLGTSASAERLVRMIPRLASSDVTVLLTGETGVGKTFVARLIHESGPRKSQPLRVINCASIPENLIESELFGHERGAFTGAVASRAGVLETAGQGTVLLDEIGELPLSSQAKLLRVLEDRRFERIGSNRPIVLQARIVAATNRDLEAMVAEGAFRSDLFFRISVVSASVPPLRERGDDLVLLAGQILADHAPFAGRRIDGFSDAALRAIRAYPWPGNVRELRNAIEHAIVLGDGARIEPSDLPAAVHRVPLREESEDPFLVRLPMSLEQLEQRAIGAALRTTGGNRTKAAALLGVNRQTLYNKLREEPPRR